MGYHEMLRVIEFVIDTKYLELKIEPKNSWSGFNATIASHLLELKIELSFIPIVKTIN
jgi:hypothetical protein